MLVALQAALFGQLNQGKLGIWEALQQLDSLDEHSRVQICRGADPQMSLFDHAVQTAELCRLAHPQQDWLHLVGLIHSLGKLMALPRSFSNSSYCRELAIKHMKCFSPC